MTLLFFIVSFLVGGLLAWIAAAWRPKAAAWVAMATVLVNLAVGTKLWLTHRGVSVAATQGVWLEELHFRWIPRLGAGFHLALDGISLILVVLTLFLGVIAVIASWSEIKERHGFYYFNLMWILAGVLGVFTAVDLFLFYCFWEMMLIPMYFLIGIWGHENRIYAAIKFFIFTQASGLLMLLAILGLYFLHAQKTGVHTFDYEALLTTGVQGPMAMLLMLGFFIAFAVKLPAVPFHSWLPDAHTQAPTAGSVILAGLLLKTGGYGLMRFVVPLFPEAAQAFAPAAMLLGVVGILYGALLAFAQTDIKRLIAYTSISHLGFVLLGVFAWNRLALQGVMMQMVCHGLSAAALFMLAGALQHRIHTRDMDRMGRLWSKVPRFGAVAMFFTMASLGLPGMGNFVAEFLTLTGSFKANLWMTVVATLGLVAATAYSLRMLRRAFLGEERESWTLSDLNGREMTAMALMMIGLLWLGLYPQPVLDVAAGALDHLQTLGNLGDTLSMIWEAHP